MLLLILRTIGILITIIFSGKKLWRTTIAQASFLFLISTKLLKKGTSSFSLLKDKISSPLILLRFWLIPVSLTASIGHLKHKRTNNNRLFISLSLIILTALIITFSTTNLLIFFIGFETTLVPTLFLITRWGMQQERIEAGYYFVFYTLARSLPLLLALVSIYKKEAHLSIPLFQESTKLTRRSVIVIFCLLAFLVKVPIFGLHLWLPKAHVEAPVAGSMILAAILLKLGGYGFIRLTSIFITTFNRSITKLIVPFCCWGGALTSIICITQTDLKSLIAYSSVSHMSFMIAGMAMLTAWGLRGGVIVMIAHGLVSSALFCIANIYYERTGTRNLSARRGLKTIFLILPTLWLLFAGANLGLPPLPNAIGELLIFTRIIVNRLSKFLPTLIGVIFTGVFSLIIFQRLKTGTLFKWKTLNTEIKEREYTALWLHLCPLVALIWKPRILSL